MTQAVAWLGGFDPDAVPGWGVARAGAGCQPGGVRVMALGASDCEALRDGVLGQPVNSLSSLAYVVAGGYVVRRGGPVVAAVALGAIGAGSLLYHGPMPPGARAAHDGSIVAFLAVALVVAWRRRSFPGPPPLALVALAGGVVVNLLTRTGAPLCRPASLAQGHAVWHVLTAVAAAAWLARWGSSADAARSPALDPVPEPARQVADLPGAGPHGSGYQPR